MIGPPLHSFCLALVLVSAILPPLSWGGNIGFELLSQLGEGSNVRGFHWAFPGWIQYGPVIFPQMSNILIPILLGKRSLGPM